MIIWQFFNADFGRKCITFLPYRLLISYKICQSKYVNGYWYKKMFIKFFEIMPLKICKQLFVKKKEEEEI